jgi:hypothetical protein
MERHWSERQWRRLVRSKGRPERAHERMRTNQAAPPIRIVARGPGVSRRASPPGATGRPRTGREARPRFRAASARSTPSRTAPVARRARRPGCGPGGAGGPHAHRPAEARGRDRGPRSKARTCHRDRPGAGTTGGRGSRAAQLHRRWSRSSPGCRHRLRPDRGGVPLPGPFPAVVLDAWSRRIVGRASGRALRRRVALDAPDMALAVRKPENVIRHPDKGGRHTSLVRCPMSSGRPPTVRRNRGRRARHCEGQERLRHARGRADRPSPLRQPRRSADRHVPLHRRGATPPRVATRPSPTCHPQSSKPSPNPPMPRRS